MVIQIHYLAPRKAIPQIPGTKMRNAFFRNVAHGVMALPGQDVPDMWYGGDGNNPGQATWSLKIENGIYNVEIVSRYGVPCKVQGIELRATTSSARNANA